MGSSDEPGRPPDVTDEETAEAMLAMAEAFRTAAAANGDPLTWESGDAARLDGICAAFLAGDPPQAVYHAIIMDMGAYLGELLVRHGDGRWTYDAAQRAAVVDLANGLRAHPHNKVAKRLFEGPEHNLLAFYRYALTREVPDGTVAREFTE